MFAHPIILFNNRLFREAIDGPAQTSWFIAILVGLYAFILVALSFYGGHRYSLMTKYWKARKRQVVPKRLFTEAELPGVTVQLPLFNEMYVIDRLLDRVAALDYPRDRLQIQVLDDSTDESCAIARSAVERTRARGLDIQYIHRTDRTGFKAGALSNGLKTAKHEFIALFDADFCPEPPLLRQLVHHFSDEKVAVVQARWGHMNEEQSLLTRVQGLMLNGHFMIEHPARNRNGLFMNFNGTGGIWRRAAIEDAGGWTHDTLTEDLDLSYRAQVRGWKFVYDPDVVCPAELPVEMNAFKTQQHRWAKGSIQVMKKVLPEVLRADLPFRVKLESFFHLTGNLVFLLMVPMCVLSLPMLVLRARIADGTLGAIIDWGIFFCATASVVAFYLCTQVVGYRRWWTRLHLVPMMLALGIGLTVSQFKAVMEALLRHETAFVRTPKFNLDGASKGDGWQQKRYRGRRNIGAWFELLFALYFTVTLGYAVNQSLWGTLPFLLLFFFGFWYVTLLTFFQTRATKKAALPAPSPVGV